MPLFLFRIVAILHRLSYIRCKDNEGYEEEKNTKREARELRKIENTIDSQKSVLELGEEYWKQLNIWIKQHNLATAAEAKALSIAIKMSMGYFPDDRQCKSLLSLREKAVGEGFPPKLK